MKIWLISILLITSTCMHSQTSAKIAIIDMEFILKKDPDYKEAYKELKKRAAEWDKDVQKRKAEIKKLKDQLNIERALLTPLLIEEKEDEIKLMESELVTFQKSKFGMDGDYFVQKNNLEKPIQDKIFTIINDYAEKKRYTMVLDKSDETKGLLYSKKGTDISDQIIRELEKANRGKLSKKEIAQLEEIEKQQEAKDRQRTKREALAERQQQLMEENGVEAPKPLTPQQQQAQKRIEDAKRKKEEMLQKRLAEVEKRKQEIAKRKEEIRLKKEKLMAEAEARKQKLREDREKRIAEAKAKALSSESDSPEKKKEELLRKQKENQKSLEEKKQQQQESKKKMIEDKKKELEEAAEERRKRDEERKLKKQEELKINKK